MPPMRRGRRCGYGRPTPSAPTGTATVNLRMPGQYYDAESGNFYNWNRYYKPSIGRYLSPDPIGQEGGINLFSYVGQNPVMASDPMGLAGVDPVLMNAEVGPGSLLTGFIMLPSTIAFEIANIFRAGNALETVVPNSLVGAQCPQLGQNFGKLGEVTTNPKIGFSRFTSYSLYRAQTRGVTQEMIQSTVQNPVAVLKQSNGRYLYISKDAAVVLNQQGELITTYSAKYFDASILSIIGK